VRRLRLDKFLQVSRLVKRRTIAQELIAAGRVSLSGRTAKPGTEVRVGDRLELRLGPRVLRVRVLEVPEHPRIGQPGLYEVEGGSAWEDSEAPEG
jgi:ribosomal 50S subunit-recycling heat shock protein